MENTGRVFRQLLQAEPYLFTGGVYDPLGAQLAERVGMKSVYLSGYSMALAQGWSTSRRASPASTSRTSGSRSAAATSPARPSWA